MSEDIKKVTNLVFQGGSVKGISYVGAISALKKCFQTAGLNFNDRISSVAGTSAGAITALVLALDYTTEDLLHHLVSTDFKQWMDEDSSRVSRDAIIYFSNKNIPTQSMTIAGAMMDFNTKLGLFPGQKILEWLEGLVRDKTGIEYCTFIELHELIQKTRSDPELNFKELTVVGFNVTRDKTQVFDYITTPNTIISDAVRISLSIPIVFLPHKNYVKKIESDGQISRYAQSEDIWVDGGITYNYPVRVFDNPDFNQATLGFYLVAPDDKHLFETNSFEEKNREIKNGWDYAKSLFESVVSSQQALAHLKSEDPKRTVYIYHGDINTLNFNISLTDKQNLVDSGWSAVCRRFCHPDLKCDVIIAPESTTQKSEKNDTKSEQPPCTIV